MEIENDTLEQKVTELSLLFEISQILDKSMDLRDVVGNVLTQLAKTINIIRGTITLLDRDTGEISIEEAYGLSPVQMKKGRYKIGEGITGKVVEKGEAVIIPRISEEPEFLDKTGVRKSSEKAETSFICVPIKIGDETIGTLSVDRPYTSNEESLNSDVRLLSIITSLIARAVKLRMDALEEKKRLLEENLRLQKKLEQQFQPNNIIGNSKVMQDVYNLIAQVSKSDTSILIRGESGTGKELIAHAIHYNSLRTKKAFVKVNCAALPESVIESELFGHERGAFTGAVAERKGRFELADGGTLFLDEIGDISPSIQIRLLRVLQEREFERVGGVKTISVNVRLIAATNRNLEDLIKAGKFRSDLYYRLNVFPIIVPPLRERKTDILLLADYFIKKYSKANNKDVKRISTPAIDMLMSYHWPGNVRELENCIERAIILSTDDVIHGHYLPPSLQTAEATGTKYSGKLEEALDNFEKEMLLESLKLTRGNMAKSARNLGITERQMGLRVRKYGIEIKRFRST